LNLFRWIGIHSIRFVEEAGRIMVLFIRTLSWTIRPPLQGREILKQMEAETPKVKVGFRKGQSVRVVDGPFIESVGVVDDISPDKGKVKVLLSLFGRETPVELDFLQVEKL
jgi:transcription antitermination factor NusG